MCWFQSTPPREGRPHSCAPFLPLSSFNPRPRAGGDILQSPNLIGLVMFQSTPPRGGRQRDTVWPKCQHVSIHAPARGATILVLVTVLISAVSIHAPARGATTLLQLATLRLDVSIHAPARGATLDNLAIMVAVVGFNPRPRAGGDKIYTALSRL